MFMESDLRRTAQDYRHHTLAAQRIKGNASEAHTTVFLSHSHHDKELVQGLLRTLATAGVDLYVDWNDSSLPRITKKETADRIRQKIRSLVYFMMLATNNAVTKSRWVPWEVGVADQAKTWERLLIVPVRPDYGSFEGSEYLNLYKRIELDGGVLRVFKPGEEHGEALSRALG